MTIRRRRVLLGLLALALVLSGLGLRAWVAGPPRISEVVAETAVFSPSDGGKAALSYSLDRSAQVTVIIHDALCRPIRTLALGRQGVGRQTAAWDGRDDAGRIVSDEAYTWTITAESNWSRATYNEASTGGQPLIIQERDMDPQSGTIQYRLDHPARVRLRVGIRGGALLRVLRDWVPQPAGMQTVEWDGQDEAGLINILEHPDVAFDISAFALPQQAIIVAGSAGGRQAPADQERLSGPSQCGQPSAEEVAALHRHALDPQRGYRSPHFTIAFPKTHATTPEGAPVVQGMVPVRIEVDERDRHLVTGARFEVILYVDTVYIYEDEDSFTPYTYQWDTTGLNPGPHVLTVNVHAYGDYIGTQSALVIVLG